MDELPRLLDGLARVDDGDPSRPRVRVLFSPLCHNGLVMFDAARARRMDASWAWIPYGADVPEQRRMCQAALDAGTPEALALALTGRGPQAEDRVMAGQDRAIADRAGRLFWDATGRALATPSVVYRRRDGVHMAVRGGMDRPWIDRLLEYAA